MSSPSEDYTSSPSEDCTSSPSEDCTSSPSEGSMPSPLEGCTPSPSEGYASSLSKGSTSTPSENLRSSALKFLTETCAPGYRANSFLLSVPGPPPDIGGRPIVRAQPEREAITQLLCIPGHDFTYATTKRRVRVMRTNMTTLTQIWMTLLLSNIPPDDHNADLPPKEVSVGLCRHDIGKYARGSTNF